MVLLRHAGAAKVDLPLGVPPSLPAAAKTVIPALIKASTAAFRVASSTSHESLYNVLLARLILTILIAFVE